MTILDAYNSPPEGAVSLGDDHYYTRGVDKSGQWVAIHEWHKTPDGRWCAGYVPFEVPDGDYYVPSSPHWDVISFDPLTLAPSLQCTACPSHGFIRDGRWVKA